MTSRQFVRCTEGHPYDRNAHEVCPICGAAPAGPDGAPAPVATAVSQRFGLIVGIVGVVIGLGGVGLYLLKPAKDVPPVVDTPAETGSKGTEPKTTEPKTTEPGTNDAPTATPETPQPAAKPDVGSLAQNLKHPPETDAEAAARVTKFMTVDPAVLEPLKRAMSPIDQKDVDPLLMTLSPPGSDTLRLSVLLREMLINQSAYLAYQAHNIGRVKLLLSALVSEPPLAPGVIPVIAHKNLAFLLSQNGDPQTDLKAAGNLALVSAKHGFAPAAGLLNSRPDIVAAAGIDPATLSAVLKLAALQDQQLSSVAAQHGVDTNVLDAVRNAFNAALQRRDWPAAIRALQSIGEPQIPWLDMRFARALLFDKDYGKFLDRTLVGSVSGAMAFYAPAMDSLGIFSEYGLDGVVQDAPNAAVWMMLALRSASPNDTSWNNTRNRYAKVKQVLTPEQSRTLAQLAQQLGAP